MRAIFLCLIFFLPVVSLFAADAPLSLQQKFQHAQEGDFIVAAQEGNYSLLFIRSITAETLILEEISVPEKQIEIKKIDWQQWVKDKAPGHTSWILYEIDRASGTLIECFSYSKNGWLYLDSAEQFLTRLFTLPLQTIVEKERKKIGPQPSAGEIDHRALWNPPLVLEGKKVSKPIYEVLKTKWPDDGSRLALCTIELYFSKQQPNFPFPYWLEVQSPHYAFKMRTIDSGTHLTSSMYGPMPHRQPQFLGTAQKGAQSWKIPMHIPSYYRIFHLFVLDLTGESKATIPVPFTVHPGPKSEERILEIATADLNKILLPEHRYCWVFVPENHSVYLESEETFTQVIDKMSPNAIPQTRAKTSPHDSN